MTPEGDERFISLLQDSDQNVFKVPGLDKHPEELGQVPEWVLQTFRRVWKANGLPVELAPRNNVIIKRIDDLYVVLRGHYTGLSDEDLAERHEILSSWQAEVQKLDDVDDDELKAVHLKELEATYLGLCIDGQPTKGSNLRGERGIETYASTITPERSTAQQAALGRSILSNSSLVVSHTHHLPEERVKYGLPGVIGGTNVYVYRGPPDTEKTHVLVEGTPLGRITSQEVTAKTIAQSLAKGIRLLAKD